MLNKFFRPALKFEILPDHYDIFFHQYNTESLRKDYFFIKISNQSKKILHINPRKIYINEQNYICFLQRSNDFLRLNQKSKYPYKSCSDKIYTFYNDNWEKIHYQRLQLILEPNQYLIFPLHTKYEYKIGSYLKPINKKFLNIKLTINCEVYQYKLKKWEEDKNNE